MAMKPSRKPDYRVAALQKNTEIRGNVGAAWKNDNGTITVVLNSFVVLHGGSELLITLFANDDLVGRSDDTPF